MLDEQTRRTIAAGQSLDKIKALHESLAQQTRQVESALVALENLNVLKDSLLAVAATQTEAPPSSLWRCVKCSRT